MPDSHTGRCAASARRKPQLTGLQRRHVERAREVAAAGAEAIAAEYDRINPDDLAQVHAYAFGVTKATVSTLLGVIAELTGSAR